MIKAFHASPYLFDKPNYNDSVNNRQNHINGLLGLWCATKKDWIEGFGGYIYSFYYDELGILELDFSDFKKKCDNCENENDYYQWREYLLKEGFKVIHIIEHSGSCDMMIVLDFEFIKNFTLIKNNIK